MTSLVQKVVDGYNNIWELRDPRVEGWLFMSSPLPTLLICLTYVYIVKVAGPRLMKNRPAFELRGVLIVYNFLQVLFSIWIFYESLMGGWLFDYSFRCQPVDYSNNPTAVRYGRGGWFHGYSFRCQPVDYSLDDMAVRLGMSGWFNGYSFRCQPVDYSNNSIAVRMVYACWWYYFSKFTEFFDTFFFVMRKKYEHVSLLHVVHHGIMPMSVWFGVRFTPGGHSTFFGLLNTFVHIVMYFYYMVAAMGPRYQKFIWWKKHLTSLQMVQFVLICVHAFQLLFIDCNYPKAFVWWIGCHGVLFFGLFSDFYVKAYIKKRAANKAKLEDAANGNAQQNGHAKKYANGHSNGHTNGSLHSKSD